MLRLKDYLEAQSCGLQVDILRNIGLSLSLAKFGHSPNVAHPFDDGLFYMCVKPSEAQFPNLYCRPKSFTQTLIPLQISCSL